KVRIDVAGMNHRRDSTAELILEPAVETSELAPLLAQRRAGHRIWAYRLSHSDVDRLKALIAAASGASGVSIAVGVEACYRKTYGLAPLPATTFQTRPASSSAPRTWTCGAASPSKISPHACRRVCEDFLARDGGRAVSTHSLACSPGERALP